MAIWSDMRNNKTANVPDEGEPSKRTLRGKLEVHGSATSEENEKKYENSLIRYSWVGLLDHEQQRSTASLPRLSTGLHMTFTAWEIDWRIKRNLNCENTWILNPQIVIDTRIHRSAVSVRAGLKQRCSPACGEHYRGIRMITPRSNTLVNANPS